MPALAPLLQPAQQHAAPLPAAAAVVPPARGALPAAVEAAVWRGNQLGSEQVRVLPTGFDALDTHLPGGGWPCRSVTEVLSAQFSVLEWRLLAPALKGLAARQATLAVVAPPKPLHMPGLCHEGLSPQHLVWVDAEAPAQRLWALEQLIKSNALGAIVGWLPQVRPEHLRRLQVLAHGCDAPVFLCRPALAAMEASAAPLRVQARTGPDWELWVDVLKRKGPPLDATLRLPAVPASLQAILTPRLLQPSRWMNPERHDVVGRLAAEPRRPAQLSVHP